MFAKGAQFSTFKEQDKKVEDNESVVGNGRFYRALGIYTYIAYVIFTIRQSDILCVKH